MSKQIRIIENLDARAWDDFVCAHDGHLLQTTAWGELKSRFGWSARRIVVVTSPYSPIPLSPLLTELRQERGEGVQGVRSEVIAGAQMLFRGLPFGLKFAYVPRGPVANASDRETLAALLDALWATAKSRGAFVLKVEPNWFGNSAFDWFSIGNPQFPISNSQSRRDFQSPISNFQSASCIQPRTTIHLDLTRDLDAILAQMKPKWRYNIRLAERKGVRVRDGNANDLPLFYELLQITSARDKFAIHSKEYYRAAFEWLSADDRARLFVAEFESEPLAMIFVTAVGREAIYLYGASGNAHRERMPNHALHWTAIQWAKARGCTRYDLWGIGATAEANVETESPHGLYQFKQGFGGSVVRYVGAYDVIFSRAKFELYQRARAFRKTAMG